jgi:adenosine/AMP kinase
LDFILAGSLAWHKSPWPGGLGMNEANFQHPRPPGGSLGVIDGVKAQGVETEADIKVRKEFLRKIGYKL